VRQEPDRFEDRFEDRREAQMDLKFAASRSVLTALTERAFREPTWRRSPS
jgi:hypothetical protein